MKTYIVYVNGVERDLIKAANHNAAEIKAKRKYANEIQPMRDIFGKPVCKKADVSVAYTEV